jgi:hypothetical protein
MANKVFGTDYTDETNPLGTETVTVNQGGTFKDVVLSVLLGKVTANATEKTTPVDADSISLWDSVASLFKRTSWANVKATLKAYFDTLYTPLVTIVASTYTPTLTNTANIDSSAVSGLFMYTRVGSIVTVTGAMTIDATAAAQVQIGISFPVASVLTVASDVGGNGTCQATNTVSSVTGDTGNARANMVFVATNTASQVWRVMFQYIVK